MDIDLFLAHALFGFVSLIRPGPNNLMPMTFGANFGFRRTIPHMLGVGLGFVLMILLLGTGLIGPFVAYPVTYDVLRVLSIAYLLYLAYRIATASLLRDPARVGVPMTFLQIAAFQWVNPKALAMALTAIRLVGAVFGVINLPSVGNWTLLGQQMARILTSPARLVVFNRTKAALLVASLYPVRRP